MPQARILVVDDEISIVELCTGLLDLHGYAVQGVTSGREAIALLESEASRGGIDLLITDIKIPDTDGLTVLRRGRELDPYLAVVVITGYGTLETAIEAMHAGAQRFVLKPFSTDDLLQAVEETLEQRRKELERLKWRAWLPFLEISHTLITAGDTGLLAGRLLEIVARQLEADQAVFLLPGADTDDWQVAAYVDGGVTLPDRITPAELWQILVRQPDGVKVSPLADNEVAIALRSGQKPIGLLHLRRSKSDLTAEERNLLALMAGPIAAALENVALYREIKESRDHFRTILDNLHDEVAIVDRREIITDVNAPFLRNRGLRREEVVGQSCSHLFRQTDGSCHHAGHLCPVERVWRTGQPVRRRHVSCERPDGSTYVIDITTLPLRNDQGEMLGAVHVLHDVTAEWELESTLATVRALGRSLVLSRDRDEIARLVVDTADRVLNFEWCDLWLVEGDYLRLLASAGQSGDPGIKVLPLHGEQGITAAVARSGQAIYLSDVRRDERYLSRRPDTRSELCVPLIIQGRVLGVLNAESPHTDAFNHTQRQVFATLADQAALALENARLYQQVVRDEREWAATFDAITDGISIHDADFRIVRVNRALAQRLGRPAEELIGQSCYRLLHHTDAPISECPHVQVLASGQPHTVEIEEPVLGGTFRVSAYPLTDEQGKLIGSVHIFQDITVQKQFQDQLVRTEKLAALGRLAASLAHEINNPLQALRSGLDLLREGVQDEKQQRYLQIAGHEVERLIDITTRMLNFYRPASERQREPLDINEVLNEVLTLTGKQLQHKKVVLVRRLEPNLPLVEAVSDQLRQVFLNIVLNALDAMPDGGTLTVTSGFYSETGEVWAAFTDTGNGIPAENIPRIFEPLFSTKPRGTGLGLATSYGIVERHGGRIEVQSQVGQGSTFTIVLPGASPNGQ